MTVKVVLFKDQRDNCWKSNRSKSALLAHAGLDYMRAWHVLREGREQNGVNFNVELPLMHLVLELLIKANAMAIDETFNAKSFSHRTKIIIERYVDKIELFRVWKEDSKKMELVAALESAWEPVRYFEASISYWDEDRQLFESMALELADALHQETGIRLLRDHFPNAENKK